MTTPPKESETPPFPSSFLKKNKKLPDHTLPVIPAKNVKLAAPPGVGETLIYLLKPFGQRIKSTS